MSAARQPDLPLHRPEPVGRAGDATGFFAHHGLWAPGVRLFRRLDFRAKALIVTAAFLAPLALLTWTYLGDKAEAIEFSVNERQGVAYLREAVPLVRLGQTLRLEAMQTHCQG